MSSHVLKGWVSDRCRFLKIFFINNPLDVDLGCLVFEIPISKTL